MIIPSYREKILALLPAAILTTSCSPQVFDYEYIYLGDIMTVTNQGRATLGGLRDHEPMPINYQLLRDSYSLIAEIDTVSYKPSVEFGVISDSIVDVGIEGKYSNICFGQFEHRVEDRSKIRFSWARSNHERCDDSEMLSVPDQVLNISVLDATGRKVAAEVIPFSIRLNGSLYEYDSL